MATSAVRTWAIVVLVAVATAVVAVTGTLMVQSRLAGGAAAGAPGSPGGPGGASPAAAMQGPPPALVRVAEASVQELQNRFAVVGRLEELRRTTVAAEVAGRVIAVPVDEGDPVEGGQTVLARIDDVWARLALESAEAQVAAAQAQFNQSQSDFQYLDQLQSSGAAKPREVDVARAEMQSDQAELNAAIATRNRAAAEVDRLEIVAPFDGVVIRQLTEVGQWVTQGTAVVEMISHGEIDAVINVPERLINSVQVGDRVEVLVEPLGVETEGKVVAVTPFGGNAARTFPVKVRLSDEAGTLKAGMSVTAHVAITDRTPQLTVPRDAVLFGASGPVVWMAVPAPEANPAANPGAGPGAGPSHVAKPISVEVLFGTADRYAIRPMGAAAGEVLSAATPVVVEGAERLMPGQPLFLAQPDQGAAPTTTAETDAAPTGVSTDAAG